MKKCTILCMFLVQLGCGELMVAVSRKDCMYTHIYNFAEQLAKAREIGKAFTPKNVPAVAPLNGIVFAGMGGSGLAGELVATTIQKDIAVPVVVVKGYVLPNWVNEHSLVVLCSYSGNTEETIACFRDACTRTACMVGITTGGLLKDLLEESGQDCIEIPQGLQPRAALGLLAIPLYFYLCKINIIGASILQSVDSVCELIAKLKNFFNKEDSSNKSYRIARQLFGRTALLYGDIECTQVVAHRWRAQLAENSKILALSHALPEFTHNELEVFKHGQHMSNHAAIWLLDREMHQRNQRRYEVCSQLIGRVVPVQIALEGHGASLLERLFYLIYLGDWVSYWIAALQGVDPVGIPNISLLKEAMR